MRCSNCSNDFLMEEAREYFETEKNLDYNHLKKPFCGECAVSLMNDLVEGIYYETCDECQKEYDPIAVDSDFERICSNEYGTYAHIDDLTDKFLCLDCALDEYNRIND